MKIAYGTYAMPEMPLEEAIPTLAQLGYDGVEICISPKHHRSTPADMPPERRARLRDLLVEHGMGVPALFPMGSLLPKSEAAHQATLGLVRDAAALARDLGVGDVPVVAIGIGGKSDQWETLKDELVRVLQDHAAQADAEGYVLAGEAHCNAAVDRSERVIWLMEAVGHPKVRFHFDIVHLFLAGEDIAEAVHRLVPYTAHTHVTDATRHADGSFELKLPGQGDLDMVTYVKAMHDAGWDDYITLEISTRVWSQPDYDTVDAARSCYEMLSRAFAEAGVARG